MEHPWEGGKKFYINGQGHMTKMAAMAINRKKPLKIFFSRTRRGGGGLRSKSRTSLIIVFSVLFFYYHVKKSFILAP